jgi:hypothetical protein
LYIKHIISNPMILQKTFAHPLVNSCTWPIPAHLWATHPPMHALSLHRSGHWQWLEGIMPLYPQ